MLLFTGFRHLGTSAPRSACQFEYDPCSYDFDCAISFLPNEDSDPHTSVMTDLGSTNIDFGFFPNKASLAVVHRSMFLHHHFTEKEVK